MHEASRKHLCPPIRRGLATRFTDAAPYLLPADSLPSFADFLFYPLLLPSSPSSQLSPFLPSPSSPFSLPSIFSRVSPSNAQTLSSFNAPSRSSLSIININIIINIFTASLQAWLYLRCPLCTVKACVWRNHAKRRDGGGGFGGSGWGDSQG